MLFSAQKVLHSDLDEAGRSFPERVIGFLIIKEAGKIYGLRVSETQCILHISIKNFTEKKTVIFPGAIIEVEKDATASALKREGIKIIGEKVETESGQLLGEVGDFYFDSLSGQIAKYYVKTGLLQNIWKGQLIIDKEQVVVIEKERIIVADNVLPEKFNFKIWQKKGALLPAGAAAAEG